MEDFGLIDALRAYCQDNDIFFIPGTKAYVEAVADSNIYANNDLIMYAEFTASPTIEGGRVTSTIWNGAIALGRKREVKTINGVVVNTTSNLDETWEQKYDNRLKDLSIQLAEVLGEIQCSQELDITAATFKMEINQFDLNADFVSATVTFED